MGSQGVGHDWVTSLSIWRRKWQPNPVFLLKEFHEQRSLVGYSPRDCKELDMTEQLTLLWTSYFRFLCSIVLYSIGLYFHHQTHPRWSLSPLWFSLFIPSEAISLLFSKSILGTYQSGEFIFQCHIFLPCHTVHGVLKARIWKWFAIHFSSGPHFVRTLQHDLSILDGPTWHGS